MGEKFDRRITDQAKAEQLLHAFYTVYAANDIEEAKQCYFRLMEQLAHMGIKKVDDITFEDRDDIWVLKQFKDRYIGEAVS